MKYDKRKTALLAIAAVAALGAGGAAIAGASSGGDDDGSERAITGSALRQASDVALQQAGGGRVTGTEVGDEQGYYEVEVTRADGSQTDVRLDRAFNVTGSENEAADKESGPGGD